MTPGSPGRAGRGYTAQGFAHPPTVIPSTAMKGILGNALGYALLFPCTSDLTLPYPLDENIEENLFMVKQKGLVLFLLFFCNFVGFFKLCLTDSGKTSTDF